MVAHLAADQHLGHHVGVVDRPHPQPDLAVVDEQRVTGLHVAGQTQYVVPQTLSSPGTSRVVIVHS